MPSDWDAAAYDRVSDPQARWAADVIARIEGEPATILDAGCGSGRVTQLLLDRFPDAVLIGMDASAAMIDQAHSRLDSYGERIVLVHDSLLRPIPFSVDTVFSNAVFHWIDDHDRLFANLAACLLPGGQLVAQWGGYGNVARLFAAVETLGIDGPHPRRFATAEETADRLRRSGFADVRTWLHEDAADFETRDDFESYLRTVCLRCHLDLLPDAERNEFVRNVADLVPDRRVDYVRLNAIARRATT